jgi:amidohydrolase/hippurate hydrolase
MLDPTIMNAALDLKDTITRFRRSLHSHPEPAFKEYETAKAVMELLEKADIPTVPLTETGVLGVLKGLGTGRESLPVTALRADMDALPVTEKTGIDYSSKTPGMMHACGHDGNTAALAGAALILSRLRQKFSGTVKFIFQPGEESLQGADTMIRQGVLDNPKVDRIFACHGWPALPTGKIGIFPGNYMAMAGKFSLCFSAPGAHGAYPHQGVDTVLAAAEAVQRINCIVSREVNALDQAVLSVCTINGGQAFNVMPSQVVMSGTFRCLDDNVADRLKEALRRVAKGICQTNNCEFELEFQGLVPVLNNGDAGIKSVQQAAQAFLPPNTLEILQKPCMGSEDFAKYLSRVPEGAFIRVGVASEECPEAPPLHSDRFNYDDDALPKAMALMAGIIMTHHGIDS